MNTSSFVTGVAMTARCGCLDLGLLDLDKLGAVDRQVGHQAGSASAGTARVMLNLVIGYLLY